MFKAVMHGNVWPAADIIDYAGRFAFRWTYSVTEWRHGGKRKFAKIVREAAAKELDEADYSAYDLSPLRCLIGDDGGRFRRLQASSVDMDVTLNKAHELSRVKGDFLIRSTHETASGQTEITVRRHSPVVWIVLGVAGLILLMWIVK